MDQKRQILVNEYKDQENFTIELSTKSKKDNFFIVKSSKQLLPEEVVKRVQQINMRGNPLIKEDSFQMPKISLDVKRDVTELIGVSLAN